MLFLFFILCLFLSHSDNLSPNFSLSPSISLSRRVYTYIILYTLHIYV